jgi:glucose-6-phosphate isomerase
VIERLSARLGAHTADVDTAVRRLADADAGHRIGVQDASFWSVDPVAQAHIAQRLGWLTTIETMRAQIPDLTGFATEVRKAGFKAVVVLGMGGSSLGAEVFGTDFPTAPGYPELYVLDSTSPDRVLLVKSGLDPRTTLYIVASKSGTTTEPLAMFQFFWPEVERVKPGRAGENFVAITDPGTPLESLAREHGFRRVVTGAADMGGRYAVLSRTGLVPAALMGVDLAKLLDRAQAMVVACAAEVPAAEHPALWLGAALGTLGQAGRDKVTFVLPPPLREFGAWVEQLLAESTGKAGTGLLPVEGESLGPPEVYGDDRVFVHLTLAGAEDNAQDAAVAALAAAGHPVITIALHDVYDLGGEFFRWELATAVAAHILGINPFDEPSVAESKENTHRLLDHYRRKRRLPEDDPAVEEGMISLYGESEGGDELADTLARFLRSVQPGDYIALLAYVSPTTETMDLLDEVRTCLRDELRVATTLGYGPRYLHATGQFHKGGPPTGVFIMITADEAQEGRIPGGEYSFAVLNRAQALGDLAALQAHTRRMIRLHLAEPEGGLAELRDLIVS